MKIHDKKLSMADKMYRQNSRGGLGKDPTVSMNGKETKSNSRGQKYEMNGKATGFAKGEHYDQANKKGSFNAKYSQSGSGSMKGGYKMANC